MSDLTSLNSTSAQALQRVQILKDSYSLGVTNAARRHSVSRSQIYHWRRQVSEPDSSEDEDQIDQNAALPNFAALVLQEEVAQEQELESLPPEYSSDPIHSPRDKASLGTIRLKVGRVKLDLPSDIPVSHLAELVLALEAHR
ncbi:transposase [Flexibacterium corallicola]|uniref:transposase n=1 Tax=Flexibacterium corallicola TaxID=3037259 RepID=UPI00286F6C85|nr:transposase [Pseudovibrio sp. M1P-2-3]